MVRFVDPDLTGRMTEYVALHVLYHHRRMSEFRELQARKVWKYLPEPAAHEVRVGLMGLGVLGSAAAAALRVFGYQLRGWSRSPKALDGVACYAGMDQLDAFLADTDILAVLLPLTPDTRGILNRRLLAKLSRQGRDERLPGPVLINAGRGGLQVDADILASLEAGELYAASARRVRGRAAAALEPAVVAPARRRHAAQRRGKRARGHRALRAAPDRGPAPGRAAAERRRPQRAGIEGVSPADAARKPHPARAEGSDPYRAGVALLQELRHSGEGSDPRPPNRQPQGWGPAPLAPRTGAGWCGSAAPAETPAGSSPASA